MLVSISTRQLWQIALGVVMLIAAGMIYIMYRTTGLVMFGWFDALGIDISSLRPDATHVPSFVLYSLPDGLWLCSYMLIVMALWRNKLTVESIVSASLMPAYALGWEMLQGLGLKSGVYDICDIISYIASIAIAAIVVKLNKIE